MGLLSIKNDVTANLSFGDALNKFSEQKRERDCEHINKI